MLLISCFDKKQRVTVINKLEAQQCKQWLYSLLARGVYVISAVLCDYEVRRSLILDRLGKSKCQDIRF